MLNAVFERKNGTYCGCTVKGHAGYAEQGQDVVCAAVSSAVQLAANLITETFRIPARVSAESNTVRIRLQDSCDAAGASILEALYVHLQCISEEFPDTIHFDFAEV